MTKRISFTLKKRKIHRPLRRWQTFNPLNQFLLCEVGFYTRFATASKNGYLSEAEIEEEIAATRAERLIQP